MEESNQNNKTIKKWHQKWWGIIFLIILVIAVVYLAAFIYEVFTLIEIQTKSGGQNINYEQKLAQNVQLPNNDLRRIVETKDDPFSGPEDARIVIVEFSDFQCPYCQQASAIIKRIRLEYADSVKIIYRDFPIANAHPQAIVSAVAAQCAAEQGMFWEYHDLLFLNQDNLGIDNLKKLAQDIGLDMDKFNPCLDTNKYQNEVLDDLQDGLKAGVSGTPTFFINGNIAPGIIPYEKYKEIIDGLIKLMP
jgi:protein-disulfide isomerase